MGNVLQLKQICTLRNQNQVPAGQIKNLHEFFTFLRLWTSVVGINEFITVLGANLNAKCAKGAIRKTQTMSAMTNQ